MIRNFILALLTCAFAQTAWAGWIVTYKDAETGEQSREYYDSGKANYGELIFAGKQMIVIDQGSRSYWKGTPEQYCHALKAQMQMMQSMMPAQFRQKPISQKQVARKKLGTKSIAGYSATGWEFTVDGSPSGRVWISSDSGLSGIIDFERSQSKQMKCFEEMERMELEGAKLYKQTVEGAFILRDSQRQVTSVERKSISSDRFNAPAGYKAFSDYQQFVEYAGNNGSDSSSNMSSAPAGTSFDMSEQRSRRNTEPENTSNSAAEEDEEFDLNNLKEGMGDAFKSLF